MFLVWEETSSYMEQTHAWVEHASMTSLKLHKRNGCKFQEKHSKDALIFKKSADSDFFKITTLLGVIRSQYTLNVSVLFDWKHWTGNNTNMF